MARLNNNLTEAKRAKNDEFYTRLEEIENELKYYKAHFAGKVVYCNCDDARESNFFRFFQKKFNDYGLKKLITTSYNENGHGSVLVYEGDTNGNGKLDDTEIKVSELKGNGDFRSEECIELLKEADIVVTNPPFSLFREYIATLVQYEKKFLVIGNNNAITYKEIFPLIKNGELWLGRTLFTGKMPYFKVPDNYTITNERTIKNEKGLFKQVNGVCWFTNLSNHSNKEELILWKKYNGEEYPKYDNYDAIEVSQMINLPKDYEGIIGIPITGLKYLWDDGTIHCNIDGKTSQFEIVGLTSSSKECTYGLLLSENQSTRAKINSKYIYARLLIKKK